MSDCRFASFILRLAVVSLVIFAGPSCVTTEKSTTGLPKAEPPDRREQPQGDPSQLKVTTPNYRFDSVNELFVTLDGALKAQRELLDDPAQTSRIQDALMGITRENLGTIMTELKVGSERNRIIAAGALGFSADPVVRPPLV